MVPNPTSLRQHHLRVHPVLCAFALFAALGSLARVVEEPYPAQITPPADLPDLPATLVVDDSVLTAAPDANFIMNSPNVHELRLKHGHLHRRQKDDDEGEDRETTKIVKNQEVSRTESEDHEGTKTKDGHGDKTHTADDEKETRSASDDNSGTKETRTVAPTQTLTEDPDELATRSLSIAPSSTATQSADPDAPLPVPFDGTATSEFKTDGGDNSCPDFISSLLNSDKFSNCYPISMLILVGFATKRHRIRMHVC